MTEYHVSTTGSNLNPGTAAEPFETVNHAAQVADAGDTVVVHEGTYREWVRPARGGRSDSRRITYVAAEGEHVKITGAEPVTGWEQEPDGVWRAEVPNSLFGEWNPFAEELAGDWVVPDRTRPRTHLGDVYLNGSGSYEVGSREALATITERTEIVDDWSGAVVPVVNVEQTRRAWYAEVGERNTVIWANFDGANPNDELVEINVRRSVFYPTVHHRDYITVRGFELAQAACPWTPPTADQPGLIGPNWAKGWIIEGNEIHDAKCSAVSLGKEKTSGHNYSTERGDKPGYQYQLESVFSARQIGWDAEHIGSHIVRNNEIYECGQNGVVGHLGCVFSTIENNHIHHIAHKREFYGYEIGGIKLHAALDVRIEGNRFHDCSLGTWLDWETQGTRITRNVYFDNARDLFIEVSHGPYIVDHNVFASPISVDNMSQGGAYVNNLVGGAVRLEPVRDRSTPYHRPHSTQVSGFAVIEGGDDRWFGNLFFGGDLDAAYAPGSLGHQLAGYGTAGYADYPASLEEYLHLVQDDDSDHARYMGRTRPVYVRANAYAAGALPRPGEEDAVVLSGDASVAVTVDGAKGYLEITLPAGLDASAAPITSGTDLGFAWLPDADFEERDGTPARLDVDLAGAAKNADDAYPAGPLAGLTSGTERITLW